MRMLCISFSLLLMMFFGVALSGCASTHLKSSGNEQDARPIEFQKIVEFDREVHFLTPDGRDTVIQPGEYSVEAVPDGLQLQSTDHETAKAVTVQAEPVTHEQSVEIPEPVLMTGENDQQAVMLLMPDGKAIQAVGSSSGIISRHTLPKLTFRPKRTIQKGGTLPGIKKDMTIPRVKAIFTEPRLGAVSPQGTVYIKGVDFGSSQGKVMLQLHVPVDEHFYVPKSTVSLAGNTLGTKQVQLTVKSWSPTQINVVIPIMSGVPDQSAVLKIRNVHGLSNMGWKVSFYAARARVNLEHGENITHTFCSNNANWGQCLEQKVSDNKPFQDVCFSGASLKEDKTISAKHTNCDPAVDRDEGKDKYTIELKNNWVIEQIRWGWKPSSTSEKLGLPSAESLTQQYKGLSKMELWVPWEVSPGPDWLDYWVDVDITGPAGILYGNRVYWKK